VLPLADVDLTGMIDMHVHTAPDVLPRTMDDVELARAAAAAGMAGVLIKSHHTLTADRALVAEHVVGGISIYGGLALNEAVGGLNPAAVEFALAMGARQVWMPTRDAAHGRAAQGLAGGISILDAEGALDPVVSEILALIRDADAILGTGHLSVSEITALVRQARDVGLRKILITHPECRLSWMEVEVQRTLAAEGAFFERCYLNALPGSDAEVTIAEMAAHIRAVGVAFTVLSTDLGRAGAPAPVEGMRAYLSALALEGFAQDELRLMAGENPARLLGL
jgi:dihydroorotase-like cyclic amidohydrolase